MNHTSFSEKLAAGAITYDDVADLFKQSLIGQASGTSRDDFLARVRAQFPTQAQLNESLREIEVTFQELIKSKTSNAPELLYKQLMKSLTRHTGKDADQPSGIISDAQQAFGVALDKSAQALGLPYEDGVFVFGASVRMMAQCQVDSGEAADLDEAVSALVAAFEAGLNVVIGRIPTAAEEAHAPAGTTLQ
jgi:hypothetical protein